MTKKQQSIINAATTLFVKNGYKKTTIKDIATYGNFSQVTVYKYYQSKYELASYCLVELVSNAYELIIDRFKNSNESFKKIFFEQIQLKNQMINEFHLDFYQFLLNELAKDDSVVKKAYYEKKDELFYHICTLGKKENIINPEYSNESIYLFFDIILEYFRKPNDRNTASIIKKENKNLINLMLYGLIGKK